MSELTVRNIDFRFEDDIAFQWNPGSPACGNVSNIMTFIAPAFERYFIRSLREAMPLITDEQLKVDVDLFCKQEGQHSKHHFSHLALLMKRYPELEGTRKQVMASYDRLLEENDLKFHMAYMANLELLFAPVAQFLVRNLETLFGQSDQRIASFILWHLIEEFEHRSVAIRVYDHLYGDYFYRLKTEWVLIRHLWSDVGATVRDGLLQLVPPGHNSIPHHKTSGIFKGTKGRLAFIWHCLDTMLPNHDPYSIMEPEWVTQWFEDDRAGVDMTVYYPSKPLSELVAA
jgi:predicted metal-dependent hydrolase